MAATATAHEPLIPTGVHVAGPARPDELDPHFSKSDGILKTYTFDYEAVTAFDQEVAFSALVGSAFFPPLWPMLCCAAPMYSCCQKDNIRDAAHAQHLAITHDGIKFVVDKHKVGCRLDCQDKGKVSKTVPYDKMTDCDIEEPAGASGACCWLVPRVLHTVHVDTASSGAKDEAGAVMHELTIRGLVDPEGFKRDVWAMKRGEPVDGVDGTVAPLAVSMIRDATHGGSESGLSGGGKAAAVAADARSQALLAEQNTLLRQMLSALQAHHQGVDSSGQPAAAQPPALDRSASQELKRVASALEETNGLLRRVAGALADKQSE